MRATSIVAIVAIVAALGAVTSLIPIHQATAMPIAQGNPSPNINAFNQGTLNAFTHTPNFQPAICTASPKSC